MGCDNVVIYVFDFIIHDSVFIKFHQNPIAKEELRCPWYEYSSLDLWL